MCSALPPWACAKLFLSHSEEKPDCSKARCEVQFSPRCPEDSVLIEGYAPPGECCPLPSRCVCDPAGCLRKVCQPGYLNILVSKASGKPGECCDLYECKPGMHRCGPSSLAALHQRVAAANHHLPCPPTRHTQAMLMSSADLLLWATGSLTSALQSEDQIINWYISTFREGSWLFLLYFFPSKFAW